MKSNVFFDGDVADDTSQSNSSIENLQENRRVAHLGDAPLLRDDGHHLGRRKVSRDVVFHQPSRNNVVPTSNIQIGHPPSLTPTQPFLIGSKNDEYSGTVYPRKGMSRIHHAKLSPVLSPSAAATEAGTPLMHEMEHAHNAGGSSKNSREGRTKGGNTLRKSSTIDQSQQSKVKRDVSPKKNLKHTQSLGTFVTASDGSKWYQASHREHSTSGSSSEDYFHTHTSPGNSISSPITPKYVGQRFRKSQHIQQTLQREEVNSRSIFGLAKHVMGFAASTSKTLVHQLFGGFTNVVEMGSSIVLNFVNDALQERIQLWELENRLQKAESYGEWRVIAEKIDEIRMRDTWRLRNESDLYDWEHIENRLNQLQTLRRESDVATIAYTLRAGLLRNIAGVDNPRLYEVSLVHTKKLIEDYVSTIVDQLLYVARSGDADSEPHGEIAKLRDATTTTTNHMTASHVPQSKRMTLEEKLQFFQETRHAFGRTALLLSGGGAMAIHSVGVIRALMEQGLLPRVISGSSAGSLIGAIVACSTEEELTKLLGPDGGLEFRVLAVKDFPDSPSALYRSVSRLLRSGVLFDSEVLKGFIRKHIGDITFSKAQERTGRVLNVTVTSTRYAAGHRTGGEGSLLLNYLTAPNVLVWSAVVASCAIPGLFEAGELLALDKNGNVVPYNPACKSSWCDGSVACDIPAKRLSEQFNINQHIVSQTNPWVVPFINSSDKPIREYGWGPNGIWQRLKYFVYSELKHRAMQGVEMGLIPSQLNWLIMFYFQSYTGDITLVPDVKLKDYYYVLQDPTTEHFEDCVIRSQRGVWPKIHLIRARYQIEQTLDWCVDQVQRQLARRYSLASPPISVSPPPPSTFWESNISQQERQQHAQSKQLSASSRWKKREKLRKTPIRSKPSNQVRPIRSASHDGEHNSQEGAFAKAAKWLPGSWFSYQNEKSPDEVNQSIISCSSTDSGNVVSAESNEVSHRGSTPHDVVDGRGSILRKISDRQNLPQRRLSSRHEFSPPSRSKYYVAGDKTDNDSGLW